MALSDDELLFRAIRPDSMYWKENRKLSSAAFKDKKGLSTDRTLNRTKLECVEKMKRFAGSIVSFSVGVCWRETAYVKPDPREENEYHTLVLKSENEIELTHRQAKNIASCAVIEYECLEMLSTI